MGRPKGSRNRAGHSAGGYRPNSGRKSRHADGLGGSALLSDAAGTSGDIGPDEDMAAAAASVAAAVVEGVERSHSTEHDADALANAILNDSSSDLRLPPMPPLPDEPMGRSGGTVAVAAAAAASAAEEGGEGGGDTGGMFEGRDVPSSRGRKRTRSTATSTSTSNDQEAPPPQKKHSHSQHRPAPKTADEQWAAMFHALRDYAAAHNGSTHVRLTPQTRSLYHWVHNQCTAYRNFVDAGSSSNGKKRTASNSSSSSTTSSMTPERIAKLSSIGLDLSQRTGNGRGANTTKWESKYHQLLSYKTQHGNCDVPYNYVEDVKFGKWCDRQRYWYRLRKEGKKSQMTGERAARLESIGLVGPFTLVPGSGNNDGALASSVGISDTTGTGTSSSRDSTVGLNKHTAKWEENFAELLRYKSEHGDCMVKYNYDDPKLARWVDRQRYWYRLMREGKKKSQMTKGRARRLAEVGFVFYVRGGGGDDDGSGDNATADGEEGVTSREFKWDARLAQLLEYKAKTGSLNVPHNYPDNPALSNWVEKQKNELRLCDEGKPQSQMTPERERKLLAAGLTVRGRGAVWAQRIQALEAYKSQHGHCRVPYSYPDDPQLAKWVSKQRTEMKARMKGRKSQLTDERIAQLDGLGFWDKSYSAIASAAVARVAADNADNVADAEAAAAIANDADSIEV